MHRMKHFTVVVMHFTPECSALIWLADPLSCVAVRQEDEPQVCRQTDPNSAVFVFSPEGLIAAVSVVLSASWPLSQRQTISPAQRRLPCDGTDNNSSVSVVHDESHPLVSSQNTSSVRGAANLFPPVKEGNIVQS